MSTANGRVSNGWDGHLPSDKMEREILNAIEGNEDEDGNKSGFLRTEEPEQTVFRQRQSNTGPKGVREDARRHHAMQLLMAQADEARRQEEWRRRANPTVSVDEYAEKNGDNSDDSFEDDEDEEFQKYKLDRLKQMQQATSATANLPVFGALTPISVDEFLAVVDDSSCLASYCVVLLHETYLAPCVRLAYKMEELAAKYDQVRFVSCQASQAKPDLDVDELPCLIVYQGGVYQGSEKRVGKGSEDGASTAQLEHMLSRLNVRLTSAAAMKAADQAALARLQELDVSAGGSMAARRQRYNEQSEDDDDDDDDDR